MDRYWMDRTGFVTRADWKDPPWDGWREILPVVVGSLAWAVAMWLQDKRVTHPLMAPTNDFGWFLASFRNQSDYATGWYLLPPSPPPICKGDPVHWWRGKHDGTGEYLREAIKPDFERKGYLVRIGNPEQGTATDFWVERVTRVEAEAKG